MSNQHTTQAADNNPDVVQTIVTERTATGRHIDDSRHEEHSHIVGYGTFAGVWLSLVMLTALTVAVAGLNLRSLSVGIAIVVATIKTTLVMWIFMHIKYEKPIFKIFLLASLLTFAIFMALTFSDIGYRH